MKNKYYWADKPAQVAFPIAGPGYPLIIGAAFITLIFALLKITSIALLMLVITLFICAFFRDPDRVTPNQENSIISPADGKIIFAGNVQNNDFINGPCQKISIFMTVFNVHVNRIPYDGVISKIIYKPGSFLSANNKNASMKNEYNAVILDLNDSRQMCVVQVAGLIARRIICNKNSGENVVKGSRFGMICFGSRVDLYMPPEAKIIAKKGDKVIAGSTIIAQL